jgi:CBS domain containing-hemolysin-like protein
MIALLKLLGIPFLVGANAFFVATEFALVSVRRARLEARAAAGSKNARAALRLLDNPTIFISAVQFGITLASLALGWIGEPTVASLLEPIASSIASEGRAGYVAHGLAIVIAFSAITFLHIVLGELMPKMVALERAEPVALFCSRPLELFAKTFSARQLIDVARDSGYLRAEERRLIHRVFEFSDTLVREAMVPRTEMAAIPSDISLEQITRAFQQHSYSRLAVYKESLDNVMGFLHSKDVMPFLLCPEKFRLEEALQPPLYVVATARLEDVLRQMQKAKSHFGFVVDEHGGLEGIITLEDLLEEIVGDISDEHDEEVNEQIVAAGGNRYVLAGGLAVRDLNRRLKLSLPESENYTTIAGFLMTEAGHMLKPGDRVDYNGFLFEVDRVERRRVITVRLELPAIDQQAPTAEPASEGARAAG